MNDKMNTEKIQEILKDFAKDGQSIEDLFRQLSSFLTATDRNKDIFGVQTYQQYLTTYHKPELLNQIMDQIKQIQEQHPDMGQDKSRRSKLR